MVLPGGVSRGRDPVKKAGFGFRSRSSRTRHKWQTPHRLESLKLAGLLPEYRDTPVREALASTLTLDIDPDQPVARRLDAVAAE